MIPRGLDAVMVAVAGFPAYDRTGAVAALSHPIIHGLLRGKLRFGGVTITDALGPVDRPRRADRRRTGGRRRLRHPAVHRFGARASWARCARRCSSGRINRSDAAASYRRIVALKRKLGLA